MNITLKGNYDNELVITADTTSEELAHFVRKDINRYIWCYVDDRRMWSHEITYKTVKRLDYIGNVCDDDETVRVHTNLLKRFIEEDFDIVIK
jgi:hypothetical protein